MPLFADFLAFQHAPPMEKRQVGKDFQARPLGLPASRGILAQGLEDGKRNIRHRLEVDDSAESVGERLSLKKLRIGTTTPMTKPIDNAIQLLDSQRVITGNVTLPRKKNIIPRDKSFSSF